VLTRKYFLYAFKGAVIVPSCIGSRIIIITYLGVNGGINMLKLLSEVFFFILAPASGIQSLLFFHCLDSPQRDTLHHHLLTRGWLTMAKLYTRTGDKGDTGIWGGQRLMKDHELICTNGDVDEANAMVGLIRAHLQQEQRVEVSVVESIEKELADIQHYLLVAGSDITNIIADAQLPQLQADDVEQLEKQIDRYDSLVLPLSNFVLPSGSVLTTSIHHARTVVRRAERSSVSLLQAYDVNLHLLAYLNRLSDYLFVLGRYLVYQQGDKEEVWLNPRE